MWLSTAASYLMAYGMHLRLPSGNGWFYFTYGNIHVKYWLCQSLCTVCNTCTHNVIRLRSETFFMAGEQKNVKVHSFGSFFIGMDLPAGFHWKWKVAESSSEVTADRSEILFIIKKKKSITPKTVELWNIFIMNKKQEQVDLDDWLFIETLKCFFVCFLFDLFDFYFVRDVPYVM